MTEQNPTPQFEPQSEPQPQPQPQSQPEPGNAYEGIIQQLKEQNSALLEQTKSLNEQIVSLINNGAQFNQQQPAMSGGAGLPMATPNNAQPQPQYQPFAQPAFNPMSLASDGQDFTLEGLAKEIGRKND